MLTCHILLSCHLYLIDCKSENLFLGLLFENLVQVGKALVPAEFYQVSLCVTGE